jgi:hypothetical protein
MARLEVAGRASIGNSLTIRGFCAAENISRAGYYNLRRKGLTPDEVRVGRTIRITPEAHARWRRKHTKRAASVAIVAPP